MEKSSTSIRSSIIDPKQHTLSISVICPVFNEAAYIDQLLGFMQRATVRPAEIWLVDGGSTDGTVEKIREWQKRIPELRLLHNPKQYVPFALNLAIPRCTGDIIVRLDAHTEYADDYFEKILEGFQRSGADVVGGPTRVRWKNTVQRAVGIAICDVFGIGNSKVHQLDYEGTSDTVTFGAWKRSVFERAGLFDEQLLRNQDDEFHYRVRALGFLIYQYPEIRLYYYPRQSFRGLFRQYFQYGLYKPLVLQKVKSGLQWRHLVPSLFVLYLVALMVLGWWIPWLAIPLVLYLSILAYKSLSARVPWKVKMALLGVYPTIHIAYGMGFLAGIPKIFKNEKGNS